MFVTMCIRNILIIIPALSLLAFCNSSFSQDSSVKDEIESLQSLAIDESPEVKERRELISTHGVAAAEAIMAGMVVKDMTTEQVILSIGPPNKKETIPPDAELWKYQEGEIAFSGGKVSYAGFTGRKKAPRPTPPVRVPNQPAQPFPAPVVQSKPIPQNNPEPPTFNPAPNPAVQSPTVKEGDSYIFETKDPEDPKSAIMTKRTVDSVGTKIRLSTININNKNAKARNLTYDRDWNLMSTRNADKSGLDYYPPLRYYDFPLMPGKNWNQSSIETDIKSGKTRTHTVTGAVIGWENISVPAGNFRAVKVSLQTEVIDSITGEVISGTDDSWFVPEIGRSVKSITSGNDGQKRIIQLMWYQLAER